MAAFPVGNEIGPGESLRVDDHRACCHAFTLPELEKQPTELVVADAGYVRGARAASRGGDDGVRGVAAKALQVSARRGFVEFDQRLTEGDDHSRKRRACSITPCRSPAASAF